MSIVCLRTLIFGLATLVGLPCLLLIVSLAFRLVLVVLLAAEVLRWRCVARVLIAARRWLLIDSFALVFVSIGTRTVFFVMNRGLTVASVASVAWFAWLSISTLARGLHLTERVPSVLFVALMLGSTLVRIPTVIVLRLWALPIRLRTAVVEKHRAHASYESTEYTAKCASSYSLGG